MLKSMFSKYILAFVLIILISFAILSSIITTMIREYALDDKEEHLISVSDVISENLMKNEIIDMTLLSKMVIPIVNMDIKIDLLIADSHGKVLLSTVNSVPDSNGMREPIIYGDLGTISIIPFEEKTNDNGSSYYVYHGKLEGIVSTPHIACATPVKLNGMPSYYVISLSSTATEDNLIILTRRAVINSSIWVMFAAVIAVYFITERIIHPLKNMTVASKQFAKGDFQTRVAVYGEDEVSELGNAFNNMAESLENLEKMRNSFLANISHDLRTPMTTIAGFIDGITSGAIPPEKHEHYLGVISAEVHRLSRLVSQILDVSRLESGDRKFEFTNFDIAEVTRIILISFEQKIEDKKLDVIFDSEEDEMPVYADKDAIYQVIYNLCHNAIKFSKEGGTFAIKIKRCENKKIMLSVYDDGQVLSKEDQAMVFDRFYKSDKSRGLDKTGVGLGLYICKTIIEAHGEEIHAEPIEDKGTEFRFKIKEGEPLKRKNY